MPSSFIITARDEDPSVLDATLAGLRSTTRHLAAAEIIVVDDGSRTPVCCGSHPVRLVRNPEPAGVSPARRKGALAATGDVLVWLDAHMSFGPGWLEQLLIQLGSDMLLCSPFWSYDLRDCHCWGADFVWNSTRDYYSQKYPGFGLLHRTSPPNAPIVEVPMVIGACYMMRRDSYEQLGGFSPHFRIWGIDEQDISARAWMAGFRVCCATYAQVGHLSRPAFPYPVSFEHLEFNQAVMLRTLFESSTIRHFEHYFDPLPEPVQAWLAETDLTGWRDLIRSRRRLSDAWFLAKFEPGLARQLARGAVA